MADLSRQMDNLQQALLHEVPTTSGDALIVAMEMATMAESIVDFKVTDDDQTCAVEVAAENIALLLAGQLGMEPDANTAQGRYLELFMGRSAARAFKPAVVTPEAAPYGPGGQP